MNNRKDAQAFGAAVVMLPSMEREEKRFALLQRDVSNQHKMRLEFYQGAASTEILETFELGTDFKVTVSQETKTTYFLTSDHRSCTLTFFKAPCTADVSRTMGSFLTPLQFIATLTQSHVPSLDTSVSTTDASLQEQIGKKAPAAAAKSATKATAAAVSVSTRISGPADNTLVGLFESSTESGGIKTLHYDNNTLDLDFVVALKLKNAERVKTLNRSVKLNDSRYEFTVGPGQGGNYISGKWKGQSKSVSKKRA